MPILHITTSNVPRSARADVAAELTEAFVALDVELSHIATIFNEIDGEDLFIANQPFTAAVGADGLAFVRVGLSERRTDAERRALVDAIVAGFDGAVAPQRIAIDFVDREPYDCWIGLTTLGVRPTCSVRTIPVAASPPSDAEIDGVRAALAADWGAPEIQDVPDDALLAEVYPLGDFDSLAKAETITTLIEVLGLGEDALRIGSAETAAALAGSIGDLKRFVAGRS
jgi:phenylpyruvate tautomerase PptA (4-oxalocrotonate tautomerase family)